MSNALSFKNQSEEVQREIKERTKFNKYIHYIKRIEFEETGTRYIFKNRAIAILISLLMIPFIILIEVLTALAESTMEQIRIIPGFWSEAKIFIEKKEAKIEKRRDIKEITEMFRDDI